MRLSGSSTSRTMRTGRQKAAAPDARKETGTLGTRLGFADCDLDQVLQGWVLTQTRTLLRLGTLALRWLGVSCLYVCPFYINKIWISIFTIFVYRFSFTLLRTLIGNTTERFAIINLKMWYQVSQSNPSLLVENTNYGA